MLQLYLQSSNYILIYSVELRGLIKKNQKKNFLTSLVWSKFSKKIINTKIRNLENVIPILIFLIKKTSDFKAIFRIIKAVL